MDYRHTEAFARELEAAALRAEGLRREAIVAFGRALVRGIRMMLRAARERLERAQRGKHLVPEA